MANFDFDQAEGLRRLLAGPKPQIVTFVSATAHGEKSATLANLAASMAAAGNTVLLLDACTAPRGIAAQLGLQPGATLQDVARQERALDEVAQLMPQGFGVATLTRGSLRRSALDVDSGRRLANAFGILASQSDILLIDAELDADDALPVAAMANGEIVVQVAADAASIKQAYGIIKRLNAQLGRRPFSVLVTGATEKEATVVFDNMAQAANRYLGLQLTSVGSVPADDHVTRAGRLGRSVVEAFPLARASVAFRQLAGRLGVGGSVNLAAGVFSGA
ncbi:MAG: antiactivator of flagellar biosynthesis FleN protein [Herminiimonas sp.]|nr:antiactivator of flagellar biosynthesis FleN protein [Herminiimonas sp.]